MLSLMAVALLTISAPVAQAQIFVAGQNDNTIRRFTTGGVGSVFVPASAGVQVQIGGMAFHSSGDLYVVNNGNHSIDKIAPDGTRSFFSALYPVSVGGIIFDNAGVDLYVANSGNGIISKYAPDGTRSTFASHLFGLPWTPNSLAFDGSGALYASLNGENTIRLYDINGNSAIFADASDGLAGPQGLVYRAGFFYVANQNNNTIWKIDSSGNGTLFAGVPGETTHGLYYPNALAFDSTGNLFVSNSGDSSIWKFDQNGVGSAFVPPYGPFVSPGAIAIKDQQCAPAVLGSPLLYAGFTVSGTIGCSYSIEWSPNSGNNGPWTPLTTITLSSSSYSYIDPTPVINNNSRFYRAIVQ